MDEFAVGDLVTWKDQTNIHGIVTVVEDSRVWVQAPSIGVEGWVNKEKLILIYEEMGW